VDAMRKVFVVGAAEAMIVRMDIAALLMQAL
jgi:hypothetical protein